MDKNEFELLKQLEKKCSIDGKDISSLKAKGLCGSDGFITEKGLKALEPYKVKRAIILAAGFGSRMVPATLTLPKPLVKVNGVRFIDTLIDKLLKNDIEEIYVVRGYLKEKFDELLLDYPFIKFIDNDLYITENNISTLMKAINLVDSCYICEADFLIKGDDVIEKYQFETNYLGALVEQTDDWCFDLDGNGNLCNYRKGGHNCVQAYGISFWNHDDSLLLRKYLVKMYSSIENRQKFWEMCIFDDYKDFFDIKPRLVERKDIVEVDSYDELKEIDRSYK